MRPAWAVLRAELRTIHRSAAMRVYAVLAIGGIVASLLVTSYWHGVLSGENPIAVYMAPANVLGWYAAPILCGALAVVVVFAATASGRGRDAARILDALHSRPVSSAALQTGRLLAPILACWWPLAAALVLTQCAGAVGTAWDMPWGGVMPATALLAFLLVDAPVALALFGGVTMLLAAAIPSRAAAGACGLALAGLYAWGLFVAPAYLLPAVSLVSGFGVLPSDFLADGTGETLLHRCAAVLAAVGFLALSVGVNPRPTDGRRKALALGAAFCAIGVAVPVGIGLVAADGLAQRQAWRSAHVQALEQPTAAAAIQRVQGRVRIAPGRGIELDVTLELRVPAGGGPLRFSFNPSMTVRDLRLDDQAAAYTHEAGLLTVSRPASGAGQASLRLRADGAPDSNFAYLDSPLEWRGLPANHPLLQLGREAVIDEPGLVALMPAARWLPAVGVNVGARPRDMFLLDLTVEVPDGWLVAGPGRRQTAGEHFRFAPSAPVANFGLVAAPYEQHAITVADIHIELLAAPGHFDKLAGLGAAEPLAARLGEIFDRLATLGLDYPYQGLTIAEVPMRLRTYSDGWRMTGLALPGVLLLREAHLTTPAFQPVSAEAPLEHRLSGLEYYFAAPVDVDGSHPYVALARQTFGLQAAAEGPGALALGFVLNDLAAQLLAPNHAGERFSALQVANAAAGRSRIARVLVYGRTRSWGGDGAFGGGVGDLVAAWAALPLSNPWAQSDIAEDEKEWDAARVALAALDGCAAAHMRQRVQPSGRDVPVAETAAAESGPCAPVGDPLRVVGALHRKGGAAEEEIKRALGTERVAALLAELRRRHAGGTFRAADVAAADVGGQAGDLLDYWLNTPGLPGFLASAASVVRLPDDSVGEPRYQTRVHVFNAEPVAGTLHLSVGGPPPRERADANVFMSVTGAVVYDDAAPVRVPGNTAVELGLVTRFTPERVRIVPSLSRNRGTVTVRLPEWADEIVEVAPFVGSRPSDWRPAPVAGIVVDDLDEGFATAPTADAPQGVLAPARWLPRYSLLDAPRWSRKEWASAWGKYRRTVARTLTGDDDNAAVFAAHLPAAGRWRLDYHWPKWQPTPVQPGQLAIFAVGQRMYYDEQGPYDMRVITATGATAVEFSGAQANAGWNTLGDFDLPTGEVRVVVSDATSGESVIADAIRWLRVDAPG